jgi:ParB/RepB/Spo0J family partition protein
MNTTTEAVFTRLPLDRLHESPFNPRRTFTAIDELAADIKAQGVIQPIVVRPIVPPLFDAGADTPAEAVAGHEIVCGHRRFRAAQLAGLVDMPVLIRSMTDEQARLAQISENLSRKDVHPFEEAEGFQALMRDHGYSADQLAQHYGQSRSYVYGRLKLLQACPEIRNACLAGEIGAETALLIARLRNDKLQGKALGYIRGKGYDLKDGGKRSFRNVQSLLKEHFTLHLRSAIFPPEDAELVPAAGVCSTCTKLSGNAPEFQDLANSRPSPWFRGEREKGEPDLCTDPDCFATKKKAHLVREAARLRAEGKVVVDGGKALQAVSATGEVKGAYVALKDVKAALKASKVKPATVLIQDPRGGKLFEAVKREDLQAAGLADKEAPAARGRSGGYDHEADRREREEREQQRLAETEANRRLLRAVHDAAGGRNRTTDELRLVLRHLIEELDNGEDGPELQRLYGDTPLHQMVKLLPTMTADALGLLLLDVLLVRGVECQYWQIGAPEPLVQMAELHGIDVDAARAEPVQTPAPAEAASTPSEAGAGAKKGARGKAAAKAAGHKATAATTDEAGLFDGEDEEQKDDAGSAGGAEVVSSANWPFPRRVEA